MPNANDRYRDFLFQHATGLEGYETFLVAELISILNSTETDLVTQINEGLLRLESQPGSRVTKKKLASLNAMLQRIRKLRTGTWADLNAELRSELRALTGVEVDFTQEAFQQAVQIESAGLAAPSSAALRAATFNSPFHMNANASRPLAGWMASLREADRKRIEEAIRTGWLEGESIDSIVRRIRGTRQLNFKDGLLQITRRQTEAVVRTAVNHFSNAARDEVWANNADIILGLRWTSVLDGRTTPICQSRDGEVAPVGDNTVPPGLPRLNPPGARPPAHAQCRSVMVAIISPEGVVGTRPFVVDTRPAKKRKVDFRKMSKDQGRSVNAVRTDWAVQRVGRLPAETTYEQFLKRQSVEFQNQVLGPARGRLFRKGELGLDDFVTNAGRRYSLSELRVRNAEAFSRAGQ